MDYFGVSEARLNDIQTMAERELKDRETRRVAQENNSFLTFADITNWKDSRQTARFVLLEARDQESPQPSLSISDCLSSEAEPNDSDSSGDLQIQLDFFEGMDLRPHMGARFSPATSPKESPVFGKRASPVCCNSQDHSDCLRFE